MRSTGRDSRNPCARSHPRSSSALAAVAVSKPSATTSSCRAREDGINQVSFELMGMTLRPSEQQAEALRQQAAAEGRSMQAVALSAIDEYIARRAHKTKVAGALQRVVREEASVLERLKDA